MNHHDILKSICDEYGHLINSEPYQITAGGRVYEFANDGIQLLAFPVEQSDLPEIPAEAPKAETVKQRIAALLTAPATHTTSAAAFANFLNLAECAKCPCCKGSGKREPYMATYEEYGFAGDEFAESRYVKIGGFPFNANLIARTLALLDLNHLRGQKLPIRIETENLHPDNNGDITALILQGGQWVFIVMGCKHTRLNDDDFDDEWEIDVIE